MCKCRKYESYKVIVKYGNGKIKEEVFEKYVPMLKGYREAKEENEKIECKVEVWGITKDGEEGYMHGKEIKGEIKDFQIEAKEYAETDTYNMLDVINKNIKLLAKREEYLRERINVINKREYVVLHQIENWDLNNNSTEKDKLYKFDELFNIRKERRYIKMELEKLKIIKKSINFSGNVEKVLSRFNDIDKGVKNGVKFLNKVELEKKRYLKLRNMKMKFKES